MSEEFLKEHKNEEFFKDYMIQNKLDISQVKRLTGLALDIKSLKIFGREDSEGLLVGVEEELKLPLLCDMFDLGLIEPKMKWEYDEESDTHYIELIKSVNLVQVSKGMSDGIFIVEVIGIQHEILQFGNQKNRVEVAKFYAEVQCKSLSENIIEVIQRSCG